jgi:hypothetical protein
MEAESPPERVAYMPVCGCRRQRPEINYLINVDDSFIVENVDGASAGPASITEVGISEMPGCARVVLYFLEPKSGLLGNGDRIPCPHNDAAALCVNVVAIMKVYTLEESTWRKQLTDGRGLARMMRNTFDA